MFLGCPVQMQTSFHQRRGAVVCLSPMFIGQHLAGWQCAWHFHCWSRLFCPNSIGSTDPTLLIWQTSWCQGWCLSVLPLCSVPTRRSSSALLPVMTLRRAQVKLPVWFCLLEAPNKGQKRRLWFQQLLMHQRLHRLLMHQKLC